MGDMADDYLAVLEKVDNDAVPTLDQIIIETLIDLDDKDQFYRDIVDGIEPGLTHLLFHPAVDGDELQAGKSGSVEVVGEGFRMGEFVDELVDADAIEQGVWPEEEEVPALGGRGENVDLEVRAG